MTVLAKSFFTLVRRHLMSFFLLSVRHSYTILWIKYRWISQGVLFPVEGEETNYLLID